MWEYFKEWGSAHPFQLFINIVIVMMCIVGLLSDLFRSSDK